MGFSVRRAGIIAALVAGLAVTHDAQADERPLLVPAVIAGTGVAAATAGVILAATAPDLPASCSGDTRTCIHQPGQSQQDFEDEQSRAGRAHTQPLAGWLTVGLGGMLVAAGVLTYVFSEGRPRQTAALLPFAGPGGGGVAAAVRF